MLEFQHPDGRLEKVEIDTGDSNKVKCRWQTAPGGPWVASYQTINVPGLSNSWDPTSLCGVRGDNGNFNWSAKNAVDGKEYAGWYSEQAPTGWKGPIAL